MATQTAQDRSKVPSRETLLEWYRMMSLIRHFEDRADRSYKEGKIAGYHHVYSGQEAVAVGAFAHLGPEDHIITAYRDHGPALARGIEPKAAMAELRGKATGTARGKGGSMHLASRELNFWGGYAIVGGHLPLGAGIALAEQYRENNTVTLCMFGDGATNIGYFHETLNLAAIWNLPIILLCENNEYGMWTASESVSAVRDIYKKACAYDMPAKQIDGMDVLAVYEGMAEAVEHIRAGNGPFFVEAKTYRYKGHGAGDVEAYRTKDEVKRYREQDPITQLGSYLTENTDTTEEQLEEIQEQTKAEVEEADKFADESPEPEVEEMWNNIFAKPFDTMSPSRGRS